MPPPSRPGTIACRLEAKARRAVEAYRKSHLDTAVKLRIAKEAIKEAEEARRVQHASAEAHKAELMSRRDGKARREEHYSTTTPTRCAS